MIRRNLARLFSLAAASLSFGSALALHVQPALAVPETRAAQSCFAHVQFDRLSIDDLTGLVHKAVGDLRSTGKRDKDVVATIGAWMALDARSCSPGQANALLRNVAAILKSDGFPLSGRDIDALLHSYFFGQPGAVAAREVETRFHTVYGLGG